jgi:hypothetical protein
VTIGLGLGASIAAQDAVSGQQQKVQARDDQKENSTREAHNSFTIISQGVGTLRLAQPITFDCRFLEEPRITTGVAIAVAPNEAMYHLPQSTVGVYRWVKVPQQPVATTTAPTSTLYATSAAGAGSTVTGIGNTGKIVDASEDAVPMYYTGAYLYFRITCDRLETVTALTAEQHPASPILHQHITFTGMAMKILAPTISTSADSPDVPPRTSTVAGTDTATEDGT